MCWTGTREPRDVPMTGSTVQTAVLTTPPRLCRLHLFCRCYHHRRHHCRHHRRYHRRMHF